MDLRMFIEAILQKGREYITLSGVGVVDEKGNSITGIQFDIDKNNRIILKTGGK